MAMLEVTSLGISFGGLRAVDELSMKIEKGGLVGLIGPNGAGKTTAFNMLTGVYRPTDGGIRLDGQNLIGKKPHEICKMGVARTFQNIRLFSELSVLDNVKTGLHNQITYSFAESMFHLGSYRKKEKQMDEKAMELLSVFGLEGQPAVRQAAQARDRACACDRAQAAAARRAGSRYEPERDRGADGDHRGRPQAFRRHYPAH